MEWKKNIGDAQRGKKKPPRTEEHKKNISTSAKKRGMSQRTLELAHNAVRGSHHTEETKRKMRMSAQWGEKNVNWKGGITPINRAIRTSLEYKLWRKAVFERDNYMCIWCKRRGGVLHADHIQSFAEYPELSFAIDNGRTLCEDCHKKRHNKFIEERIPIKK